MRAGVDRNSATPGRGVRHARLLSAAVLLCAAAALVLLLPACSLPGGSREDDARAGQEQTLQHARVELSRAAEAVRARDRAAFTALLPLDGASSSAPQLRKALDLIYDTLAPLPWRTFSFAVTPLDAATGIYRVVGSGQLGDAGPPDRLALVRYLKLTDTPDGAMIAGDETPEDLRRRYLMALHDPFVLQRPGFIVLADRWARGRARSVLAAAELARPRLATLGLDTSPTVLVTVYGSAEDVRDALAVDASSARLVFFSHRSLRVAKKAWPTYDVGVMGPWLRDPGISIDTVLVHELAHAYSVRWFGDDEKPPSLLVEGIAQAAEGVPASPELRDEVATGDQLWPLPESFAVADVWDGGDAEAVGLGYEVGGSLVDYVVSRWGASRLRPFVQAVAAAEPTEAGMDAALGEALGVGWREFYAGWRRSVLRGG